LKAKQRKGTTLTRSVKIGDRLKAVGLLLTPEERAPPRLLLRANELAASANRLKGPHIRACSHKFAILFHPLKADM
jgi:membrane glycosyltransferase